jgi:hypothetical protein
MDVWNLFLELGFFHILDLRAWDHLLFLVVLVAVYGLENWRQWGAATAAFSLGHTLSLVFSMASGIPLPESSVEIAILLTLVLTAAINLHPRSIRPKGYRRAWISGLLGLVHGLGFAKDFRGMVLDESLNVSTLLAFTAGIELGQLVVVLVALSFSTLLESAAKWKPREWVLFCSGGTLFLSLYLLVPHFFN